MAFSLTSGRKYSWSHGLPHLAGILKPFINVRFFSLLHKLRLSWTKLLWLAGPDSQLLAHASKSPIGTSVQDKRESVTEATIPTKAAATLSKHTRAWQPILFVRNGYLN